MSYDLILWRGPGGDDESNTWRRLARGEHVASVASLTAAEVKRAFRLVFGADVEIGVERIVGPAFALSLQELSPYLHICCPWSVAGPDSDCSTLDAIARVASALRAHCYNPQLAPPASSEVLELPIVELAELGESRSFEYEVAGEDRAQSFAQIETWRVIGLEGAALHRFFVAQEGARARLSGVRQIVCDYVRLTQPLLPLEILLARCRIQMENGSQSSSGPRLLGIVQGRAGYLKASQGTMVSEYDGTFARWTGVTLSPNGPASDSKGAAIDLSKTFHDAAWAAMTAAREGQTRPLRDFMVTMTALDAGGLAEELFDAEIPAGEAMVHAFEMRGAHAALPVWSQQAGGIACEARLEVIGGFTFELAQRRPAKPRHAFAPPLAVGLFA
jgi:hypothetical protein